MSSVDRVFAGGARAAVSLLAQAAEAAVCASRAIRTPALSCSAGGVGGRGIGSGVADVCFTRRLPNLILVREQLTSLTAVGDAGLPPCLPPLACWAPTAVGEKGGAGCGRVGSERTCTAIALYPCAHGDKESAGRALYATWRSPKLALERGLREREWECVRSGASKGGGGVSDK